MSVFSWLSKLLAPAPEWMERQGLGGMVGLQWKREAFPLDLMFVGSPDIARWLVPLSDAAAFWNTAGGRHLYAPPVEAIGDMVEAFSKPDVRAGMRRQILVQATGDDDRFHGDTDVEFDRRTGELWNAVITLPRDPQPDFALAIVKHELGHALGLDHGPEGTLMGPHLSVPNPELSFHAQVALRRAYE